MPAGPDAPAFWVPVSRPGRWRQWRTRVGKTGPFSLEPMRAQCVQVMVRFTGHTFQVPLRLRSGRPGNSLRSNSPGRFSCAASKRH